VSGFDCVGGSQRTLVMGYVKVASANFVNSIDDSPLSLESYVEDDEGTVFVFAFNIEI